MSKRKLWYICVCLRPLGLKIGPRKSFQQEADFAMLFRRKTSSLSVPKRFPLHECFFFPASFPLALKPVEILDTSSSSNMKNQRFTSARSCTLMSCLSSGNVSKGLFERMTKELTALGSTHDDDQDGLLRQREKHSVIDWRIDLVFPSALCCRCGILEGRVRWDLAPTIAPFFQPSVISKEARRSPTDTSFPRLTIHKKFVRQCRARQGGHGPVSKGLWSA